LSIDLDSEIGTLNASSAGVGYWSFTGKTAGEYVLTIEEGDANRDIELTILPGDAIRIISELDSESLAQGDVFLFRANGIDSYGNEVTIDADNTTVSCNAGPTSHVTADTWEVEITTAGNDRSCTIMWDGLIAKNFFDVESVLLGGAVGSTNTAMGLGAFLLSLILITLIVLIRKANQVSEDDWVEDAFDYNGENPEDEPSQDNEEEVAEESESKEQSNEQSNGDWIDATMRTTLAAAAAEIGVMQAAPGTEQGATGWYVDVSEEVQYWNVSDDGTWSRVS